MGFAADWKPAGQLLREFEPKITVVKGRPMPKRLRSTVGVSGFESKLLSELSTESELTGAGLALSEPSELAATGAATGLAQTPPEATEMPFA